MAYKKKSLICKHEGLSSQFQIAYKRCVIALTHLILALKVEARNAWTNLLQRSEILCWSIGVKSLKKTLGCQFGASTYMHKNMGTCTAHTYANTYVSMDIYVPFTSPFPSQLILNSFSKLSCNNLSLLDLLQGAWRTLRWRWNLVTPQASFLFLPCLQMACQGGLSLADPVPKKSGGILWEGSGRE